MFGSSDPCAGRSSRSLDGRGAYFKRGGWPVGIGNARACTLKYLLEVAMFRTKIRKVEKTCVVMVGAKILAALDVKEGDTAYVTRLNDSGLKMRAHDPDVVAALASAREVMD